MDKNKTSGVKKPARTSSSYMLLQKSLKEVEKERANKEPKYLKSRVDSKNNEDKPSTSRTGAQSSSTTASIKSEKTSKSSSKFTSIDYNIPCRTSGDLYCQLCDAHMNSEQMWDAHIRGKRHIKNVKKGESESKYDDLDIKSEVQDVLDDITDSSVVGLKFINELWRREPDLPPVYLCHVCNANIATGQLVVEHVLGIKHKTACVKEQLPDQHKLLQDIGIKKSQIEPLVESYAAEIEKKFGRGKIQVRKEKPKPVSDSYYKRSHRTDDDDDDDDDDYYKDFRRPPKSMKN